MGDIHATEHKGRQSMVTLPKADVIPECPVCREYILPPIFQCKKGGHLICEDCRMRLDSCPVCRGPLGDIRNYAIEAVVNNVISPCKYASRGCEKRFIMDLRKNKHEAGCSFMPVIYDCPFSTVCQWKGNNLQEVDRHLINEAMDSRMKEEEVKTYQVNKSSFLTPEGKDGIQKFCSHFFKLMLKTENKKFYAVVQMMGPKQVADKFVYRLELNGETRRLVWEATPRSLTPNRGASRAFQFRDCLIFSHRGAELLAQENFFIFTVTISRREN